MNILVCFLYKFYPFTYWFEAVCRFFYR